MGCDIARLFLFMDWVKPPIVGVGIINEFDSNQVECEDLKLLV